MNPCNFLKKYSTTKVFLHVFRAVALSKLSENFLRDIFAKHFLTKLQASKSSTLLKITLLTKIYRINFNSSGDLYCVKEYSYHSNTKSDADANAEMPMPRFPNGRFSGFCQCRMEMR